MDTSQKSDLLSSNEYTRPLVYASVWQRFIHRVVDVLVFYTVFISLTMVAIVVYGAEKVAFALSGIDPTLDRIFTYVMLFTFIGLVEGITKGKSLGKLLTGTRAVYDDGTRISFTTGFLRGISQAVPFEVFSAFGAYPWHDEWTKTRVVTEACLAEREAQH